MVDGVVNLPRERDATLRTLTGISIAHWASHFYIFVLPMLFPFLKERLGVGFIDLGFALTVFAAMSALTQAPVGYVVDRVGARLILLIGLTVSGLAFVLLTLHLSYVNLLACAAVLGFANSVYHPANYAILSAHMDERRMGRAFSIHTFAGFVGGAVTPAIVAGLLLAFGGRGALLVISAVGPLVALLLAAMRIPDAGAALSAAGTTAPKVSVMTPAILLLAAFFLLLGLSNSGIGSFGVVALMNGYGSSLAGANLALTAFLGASATGVLAGGWLADRTARHGRVAAACFGVNALIVLVIALTTPPQLVLAAALTVAGFLSGVIAPSRDMMVRNAAPPGAAGRAFGIVSTGFNISGIMGPLLYGWIMDRNMPHWVFGAAAIFMVLTVLLALIQERNADRRGSIAGL